MTATNEVSRRDFVKAGAVAGAGLVLSIYLPGCGRGETVARAGARAPATPTFLPNAWLRIGPDGWVTVLVDRSEMGQGVDTSLPMLLAEELDADWKQVRVEHAPAGEQYINSTMGIQGTGGSSSVRAAFKPLREAGAKARAMLVAAAAQTWGVDAAGLKTANGMVIGPEGKKLSYGELAEKAATMPVPDKVELKDPKDWKLIGTRVPRVDLTPKVTGTAGFGIDATAPGMLTALVARPAVFGGKVKSFNATAAKAVPGVKDVIQISNGVAVVADTYWNAKKGRDALKVVWDDGPLARESSESIRAKFVSLANRPGVTARREGNTAAALVRGGKKLEAVYEVPYLAHACMEPMNTAAHVRSDGVTIWSPTQFQMGQGAGVREIAAQLTGIPESKVNVITTYLGGGFGRRFELDFVQDAVEASKAMKAPVKVIYSREDDIQHDFYRPATYNRLAAALNDTGAPVAWTHRIVGPSILARFGPLEKGIDGSSVEAAVDMPYAVPNVKVEWVRAEPGIPIGFWRSVGNSQNSFIVESFIDELAHAAGKDPFEFRRTLLEKHPRHKAVLELAAEKAGWGQPLPEGRARGIAVQESFGSWVAEVAEVSVSPEGKPKVHRIVCAVDCGTVVNPDTVEAQMQSGIVYGLSAALSGEITIKDGRVVQGNFDSYPVLRMNEMPVVEVHIVKSTEPPGGVGEPGTPPAAPALCNAIFALTGKRVRKLPIRPEDIKTSA
jgi:isoquinoline 1-oxidoreductase subunit beta